MGASAKMRFPADILDAPRLDIQGDHGGFALPFVDIKLKVVL